MVSVAAQLSLFDTTAVIKPLYKVGDRVKIRKKPLAASYVKKGDIVEINAIHPLNGSIKFWNERSECWEFIHPDEIGSIVESFSFDDSVSKDEAQIADTEYTVPPADTYDSVTSAEVAVTELTPAPGNDDSVTSAEVAVTELTPAPGNDDSVTSAEVAVTELTPAPGNDDYLPFDPISTYRPRGTAPPESGKYYRLSYREGGRVRHQHIRGGNTNSPIAQARVQEVRSLLAAGIAPAEIAAMLKT